MKKLIGQQGETRIVKIDKIPQDIETKPCEKIGKNWIISHSEDGNHHLLMGGEVLERTDNIPDGLQKIYAILDK